MKNENYYLTMRDGSEIWVNRWLPDDESKIKAVIQFHHGMEEYSMRYVELAQFLTDSGFVFSAFDIRGHGKTVDRAIEKGTGKIGKLADKNGFITVLEDLNELTRETKSKFPDKKIFLLGYSFGSFVSQGFIEKYGDTIDGCVLCGSKGPSQLVNFFGMLLGKFLCLFGRDVVARKMEYLPFPLYLKRVPRPYEHKLSWMATDQSIVRDYLADELCFRGFCRSFLIDLMGGCFYIHKRKNIKKIPAELPVYFIYGAGDPVGEYGKTIHKLIKIYEKNGMKNISVTEYADSRHELLRDVNYKEVRADIVKWIEGIL